MFCSKCLFSSVFLEQTYPSWVGIVLAAAEVGLQALVVVHVNAVADEVAEHLSLGAHDGGLGASATVAELVAAADACIATEIYSSAKNGASGFLFRFSLTVALKGFGHKTQKK